MQNSMTFLDMRWLARQSHQQGQLVYRTLDRWAPQKYDPRSKRSSKKTGIDLNYFGLSTSAFESSHMIRKRKSIRKRIPIVVVGDAASPTGFARVLHSILDRIKHKYEIHHL